jgi:hypothetical protein
VARPLVEGCQLVGKLIAQRAETKLAIRSVLWFGHSFDGSRVVLRVHALIEAVILHPGVFAGFIERHRAVGAAYRATEGLRPVINAVQFAKKQPRVAPATIAPDPQRAEGLAESAEAVGHARKGSTMLRG